MENINVLEVLILGTVGLGLLLALLSYYLLSREQRVENAHQDLLRSTYYFMGFSIILCTLGLISATIDRSAVEAFKVQQRDFIAQGAPLPTFQSDQESVDRFNSNETQQARDKFITDALSEIDAGYREYSKKLTAKYDSPVVPALISAMSAQRKQAMFPILEGLSKSIVDYSLHQAVRDLSAYYGAGTATKALLTLQLEAGLREANADDALRSLRYGIAAVSNIRISQGINGSEISAADMGLTQVDRLDAIAARIRIPSQVSGERLVAFLNKPPIQDSGL